MTPIPHDVETGDPGPAGIRAQQGGQDADGGCLARTVGPEQGEHGAPGHRQFDAVQDSQRPVSLLQAVCLDRELMLAVSLMHERTPH